MRIFRVVAVSVFAALFSLSVMAQTTPSQPTTAGKIGLVSTMDFLDSKAGITKYVNAMNSLETEFKPRQTELDNLGNRIQTIAKELQTMREQAEKNVPVDQKVAVAKQEEGERLQRELKFKQEDAKAAYERRFSQLIGPIQQDIGKALQEFAKQKGFSILLDIDKDQSGLILALDDKIVVTKEFIAYYNTRPATPAGAGTASTPK